MQKLDYLNFDLQIESAARKYRARVVDSPSGEAAIEFTSPFSDLELENFYLKVGRTRQGVRSMESPEMEAVREFGLRLFEAVFSKEVYACFRSSLTEAANQNKGLRLRLRVSAHELNNLPWEFLYSPSLKRFLAWSIETPLVRYLELPQAVEAIRVEPPVKVLVFISSPSDFQPLNVEQEWERLSGILKPLIASGQMRLERVEQATLSVLQQRLRRDEYHIFHFIGHGGFDERAQDGVLVFEDEDNRGRPLSGQYLGTLLHDHKSLRLAVLNACEGARTSPDDPFAGVAQCLVQQGIPAVIAMQFEITDQAAITFAQEFYTAVVDGFPVDAAVGEARKAIVASGNDIEWGTPVLFTRSPDGHIFEIEPPKKPSRPASRPRKSTPAAKRPAASAAPARGPKIVRGVVVALLILLILMLSLSVVLNTIVLENSNRSLTAAAQTGAYKTTATQAALGTGRVARSPTPAAATLTATRPTATSPGQALPTAKSATPAASATALVKLDLVTARKDLAGVQANGFLYAIAGANDKSRLNSVEFAKINPDDSLGAWQTTSALKSGRSAAAAAASGNYIYVTGGEDGAGGAWKTVERAALKADGSLGAWEEQNSLLEARSAHAALISGGYLYVIAGSNAKGQPLASVERAAIQANGSLGKWEAAAALRTARSGLAAAAYNNFIYVVGGWDGLKWAGSEWAQVNPGAPLAAWKSSGLPLTPRESAGLVLFDKQALLIGGSTRSGGYLTSIEIADVAPDGSLGAWRKFGDLKTARGGLAVAVHAPYFYVFGGENPAVLGSVERVALP